MFKQLRLFWNSDPKTKNFILTWAIYLIALIGTTIYCYARIDFVRSGPKVEEQS